METHSLSLQRLEVLAVRSGQGMLPGNFTAQGYLVFRLWCGGHLCIHWLRVVLL